MNAAKQASPVRATKAVPKRGFLDGAEVFRPVVERERPMKYNLKRRVLDDIISLAQRCEIKVVILFGSRARGDHRERRDIDLAIRGGNTAEFITSAEDDVCTLLMLDIVDLDKPVQTELLTEIERDRVALYEEN